jgi:SOS-response transcriptional repressor LexA
MCAQIIGEDLTFVYRKIFFEPSLSSDNNAFYLRVTPALSIRPIIGVGDLILIEPAAEIREGDMVLFLSPDLPPQRSSGFFPIPVP